MKILTEKKMKMTIDKIPKMKMQIKIKKWGDHGNRIKAKLQVNIEERMKMK
jgi:hypothetical protein